MSDKNSSPNRRELLGGAATLAATAALAGGASRAQEPSIDVEGRSVLITGTSSGFGKLTALHLARNGAHVFASMRNMKRGKRPEAQELADIASDEKMKLDLIEIDVTSPSQVKDGVGSAQKKAGGALDVLVNNAGIGLGGPIELHDEEALELQMQTNLFGYHRMARAVLPAMRSRKEGYIINVSSQLGRIVLPNIGMYCATKFGLEAMFETLAYELAPFGVEVTIVQPGGYPTKIWENGEGYINDLIDRQNSDVVSAYETHLNYTRGLMTNPRETDPTDVSNAIGALISLPKGDRPLRKPVHPNTAASEAANNAMAQIQANVLGRPPYEAWHKFVAE